jgi:Ca-activated chloride channel family protein
VTLLSMPLVSAMSMALLVWSALQPPAPTIDILIPSPPANRPALGQVDFRAEVIAGQLIAEVILVVDGEEVVRFQEPPYRITLDVGQANVEHRFEVTAWTIDGTSVTVVRETPRIHIDEEVDLELQQLYVTVTRDGRRVLDLQEADFEVFDSRQRQDLVTFETGEVPLTAALLVDASDSMRGVRLRNAVEGATTFVSSMESLDEAMLVLFSDRLLQTTPFANDPAALSAILESVEAAGGTAINDSLYFAVKSLEARQGRRVVILLSDGVDIDSVLPVQDVLWTIRRSRSLIYWIRLMTDHADDASRFSAWRGPAGHQEEIRGLEEAVRESGGRIVPIPDVGGATTAFQDILRELREQYVLGYYPSLSLDDGSWHKVQVKVPGKNVQIRTRGGYVDY